MDFVKSVLKWASIWTVLLVAILVVNDLSKGRPFSLSTVLVVAVVVWVVMAGLVAFSKVMSAASRLGTNIGRAVVQDPKQDAATALGKAAQDAIRPPGDPKG